MEGSTCTYSSHLKTMVLILLPVLDCKTESYAKLDCGCRTSYLLQKLTHYKLYPSGIFFTK